MAKGKKSKKRSRRSQAGGLSAPLILAALVLTIVAVAALYLARGPAPLVSEGGSMLLDDLEVEIESVLLRSGYALDEIEVRRGDGLLNYDIRGRMPANAVFVRLDKRLQSRFNGIVSERRGEAGELLIYRNGALACILKFEQPEAPYVPPPVVADKPLVVIIMDDLGRSLGKAKQVVNLGIPVTFAILPGESVATEVALLAARSGYEIMIHVPMEPHSYPATNPGSDALLLGQSAGEIERRVRSFFSAVPYAAGANNHMGSRFTEFEPGMEVVLKVMREKGMFFVDSRTTGRSVVQPVASRLGVPSAVRDVFLDNVAEVDAISVQIDKLVRLALKRGQAIGICHPYPETIEALRLQAQRLRNGPVKLVFASKLVTAG